MPATTEITQALKTYWGFDSFLPLQKEAMECALDGRDSVVVLPTGGGKSLCFQVPAVIRPGMMIVISPLISLMKDQVDGLVECGVPAARLDSTLAPAERRNITARITAGDLKLLYLAPERLLTSGMLDLLGKCPLSGIAIDEAHCISMWGHDFRPEYRQLGTLKDVFPGTPVHAFTATATDQVRADIARQLRLARPLVLVGSFDRPNLVYKVERRIQRVQQIRAALDRHPGESGIIYCIRRDDVDEMCATLSSVGYSVLPYHAGMEDHARRNNQEAFDREEVDTIIATVAFGMGIDKSNVRYVIHAGMPQSLEHYQQESGRAGRDGLEADCLLLHSPGDYAIWKRIQQGLSREAAGIAEAKLNDIYRYCTGAPCRHRALLAYFGQELGKDNCEACDVCLGEIDSMGDSLEIAQKILSCVGRLRERFGGEYTTLVLLGSREERLLNNHHDQVSTYGLLKDFPKRVVRDWVEQLVGQGCLAKFGEYNILRITPKGKRVLKGEEAPQLLRPAEKPARKARVTEVSWEGVDADLFEVLRQLRREISNKRGVPPFVVFGDASLREMSVRQPTTRAEFLTIKGVGEKKLDEYADAFLAAIEEHRRERQPSP
ncbi:MAG: DNA helicase RecQ [Candidatus Eisenbacteria sp.]|nr:DNA helicase RecQ [Candidatus Eisenbacteria bacterium]